MRKDLTHIEQVLKQAMEHYGFDKVDAYSNIALDGHTFVMSASVDVPRGIVDSNAVMALEGVLKVVEFQIGTSNYIKELTAEKDSEIEELTAKVKRLENDLSNSLGLVPANPDNKLSVL